jgi:hypothetical protein
MANQRSLRGARTAVAVLLCSGLGSCGGGGGSFTPGGGPPPYTSVPQVKVSQPTSLPAGCDGVAANGTLYTGAAIEPQVSVSPFTSSNLVATWQQNVWSTGGSQVIGMAASFDGGNSWSLSNAAFFSRCAGGSVANAGNYARARNAWVSFTPSGVAYALALGFTGTALATGSSSAMLVSRSLDGGSNWSLPIALIQDGAGFFNDKGSITADPNNNSFVYAVWDRLSSPTSGMSYFSLTANGSSTWSVPTSIYTPGANNQTFNNIILVTATSTLLALFNEIDTVAATASSHLKLMQSTDHGTTWSIPVAVSDIDAVGTTDPNNGNAVSDGALGFSAALGPTGVLYVVWQDARFSSDGMHDAIAFSSSSDGGATWSDVVAVNGDTSVQAFTPTVNVSAAGVIAVTYYDLRNAHYSTSQLLADAWIVTSSDGTTFTESHLSGPFDLQLTPLTTQGYALGDYQALVNDITEFEPFYAQSNAGTTVSTDVFFSFPAAALATAPAAAQTAGTFQAMRAATPVSLSTAVRARISQRIRAALAQRTGAG